MFVYVAVVYYSWLLGLLAWILSGSRGRPKLGLTLIIVGALVQMAAFAVHKADSARLEGQPDALYTWVVPLLFALVGCAFWLAGAIAAVVPADRLRPPKIEPRSEPAQRAASAPAAGRRRRRRSRKEPQW